MNNLIKAILLFFFLGLSSYGAETLKVPFYAESLAPLVIIEKGEYQGGLYHKFFSKILSRANIKFKLYPLPKSRLRQKFWEGGSLLTCCDNPAWRTFPKEIEVQKFSRPFMELRDVIVTRKDKHIELSNLSNIHFALKRGFSYKGDSKFKKISYLNDMNSILQFVELNRADAAIVNEYVFKEYSLRNKSNLIVAKEFSKDSIHIRVHSKREDLLKKINKAISDLKHEGYFQDSIDDYLK
ncbi:ABC transporter substrate-binding protein [Halobacteriovorax sp. HLS]|uniref:substrate-binding periplasmic protein n=1 Tax=Halobacteriovorax sp. HLS TaxID=2234000 RepID=UPI000FDC31CB|nr:transporter substrate-binding domain-containing protein [Halobacteriovorax sp. HLS]